MTTYCGKNCDTCTYREELGCSGCQSGPGRAISGDCKLARCCRDKGHETCETCAMKRNCGIWLDKGSIPRQRIERKNEEKAQQELISKRAPFLGKWLWILFWLVVPSEIAGIMTMDQVVVAVPALKLPGMVLSMLCSLIYALILLRVSSEHEFYKKAGLFGLGHIALECIGLILESVSALVFVLAIGEIVLGLLLTYHEYKAHGDVVYPVDKELSECWEKLWKWKIYSMAGLFGSVILMIFSRFLGVVLLFASLIFVIVVGVLKFVYLYRTAKAFRSWKN